MGLKSWLKRLDKTARGSFASFELLAGTTCYNDPRSLDLFRHWVACATAGNNPDREALVRERDIRPRSLVAGRDLYDQEEAPDLSEPSERREDV
jgi:hypothetical protein